MLLLLLACEPTDKTTPTDDTAASVEQDVRHASVSLDLTALEGSATLDVVRASAAEAVVLDIGDLSIADVTVDGERADFSTGADGLRVETGPGEQRITLSYGFAAHDEDDWSGWMPERGVSFIWPYFCGNLYPCDPDPADGLTFDLAVTGGEGTAIYPEQIPAEAPPYMLAVAVGEYTETSLGTTSAGTEVLTWGLPGEETAMAEGTSLLVGGFDWLETHVGPYAFGSRVGSVSVVWDDYGGMEHHPYWHISNWVLRSQEVHIHEAAHGWYGDGVRLQCWEDLTLSEGTTSYLAARALTAAGGPDLYPTYVDELRSLCQGDGTNAVAMPGTCGEIDILTDPLWSMVPYMKGACFYEEVEDLIGQEALVGVLSDFYQDHVGQAARMQDVVDAIAATLSADQVTPYETLVAEWLTTLECPEDYAARCGDTD